MPCPSFATVTLFAESHSPCCQAKPSRPKRADSDRPKAASAKRGDATQQQQPTQKALPHQQRSQPSTSELHTLALQVGKNHRAQSHFTPEQLTHCATMLGSSIPLPMPCAGRRFPALDTTLILLNRPARRPNGRWPQRDFASASPLHRSCCTLAHFVAFS